MSDLIYIIYDSTKSFPLNIDLITSNKEMAMEHVEQNVGYIMVSQVVLK